MRIMLQSVAGTVAALALQTGAALSLSKDQISAYDFNKNGLIEKGGEADGLLADPGLITEQKTLVYFGVQEKPAGVSVAAIAAANRAGCNVDRRFRLRSGLSDFSVTAPNLDAGALSGATFSYSHDGLTQQDSWTAKGALFWVLGDPCAGEIEDRSGAYVSRYGFAPFLEFNGSEVANTPMSSRLRAGVLAEFQVVNSALFPIQIFHVAPYAMTDFDGDANIIGLNASWTPYDLGLLLNGRVGDGFWWQFNMVADFRDVRDGGQTGLTTGTDQGWVGANLGATYSFRPKDTNGFYTSLSLSAFYDVLNSDSAEHLTVKAGAFLNTKRTSALEIVHRRGTHYSNLTKEELTTVSLALKF